MPAPFLFFLFKSDASVWMLIAAIGIAVGLYLFVKGFRLLRFKRLILDTPLSRIHSASIGLVEVTGTPVGPYLLSAPVTGEPCFYYRVQAFQWVETDNNKHQWKGVLDESLCIPFFLEDTTGRVLVVPQGANMDVHRSFSDEIGFSIFQTPGLCPPNVRDFLAKRSLVPAEKIKLEERIIPQGFPLFVFGTLGENPAPASWSAQPHQNSPLKMSFSPLGNGATATFTLQRTAQTELPTRTASTVSNVLSRAPGVQVQTARWQVPKAAGIAALADPHDDAMPPSGARSPAAVPPNPAPSSTAKTSFGDFDLRPSAAISKGERNEPFAISGHSQREVVGKLAWQSAACIWGGPLLVLFCVYVLMSLLDWIR